jgi:hypothetical protein
LGCLKLEGRQYDGTWHLAQRTVSGVCRFLWQLMQPAGKPMLLLVAFV